MAESSVSLTDKSRLSFGVQETEELEGDGRKRGRPVIAAFKRSPFRPGRKNKKCLDNG